MDQSRRAAAYRQVCVLLALLGLLCTAVPAQDQTAEQEAAAIGGAVDQQMAALRGAIQSGEQAKVKAHLEMVFPLLRAEKDARMKAYVEGARTGQVQRGQGSGSILAAIPSVMQTIGYSGYVADGLNLMTLGDIGLISKTASDTLDNLGDLGLILTAYDCIKKYSEGRLDEGTKSAAMMAVYCKLASHFLGSYGNALGAAANTGQNLGKYAKEWALSDAEQTIFARMDRFWHDRARVLGGWRKMWTGMWDVGGSGGVLRELRSGGFWSDPFVSVRLDGIRNAWALPTWKKNYRAVIGERYFREYVAKILANHAKEVGEKQREKTITGAKRFLDEFPRQTITVVTSLPVVSDSGRRMEVDRNRVVVGLYAGTRKLLDLPGARQQVSAETNLVKFLEAVGKSKGRFTVQAFWRRAKTADRKAPDELPESPYDEKTGLVRATVDPWMFALDTRTRYQGGSKHGGKFEVGKQGDSLSGTQTYAWLGPVKISLDPIPVKVTVLNIDGSPAANVSLLCSCGTVAADEKGVATVPISLSGKNIVAVGGSFGLTGDYLVITGEQAATQPDLGRTLRMKKRPAAAPLEEYGVKDPVSAAKDAQSEYASGKSSFARSKYEGQKTLEGAARAGDTGSIAWRAHCAVRLREIAEKYAPRPNMSPAAAAARAKAARRAREALNAKGKSYLKQFSDARAAVKQSVATITARSEAVSERVAEQHAAARQSARALGQSIGQSQGHLKRIEFLTELGDKWAQPSRFRTLADVQFDRRRLVAWIAEAESLSSQIRVAESRVKGQWQALKNELGGAMGDRTPAIGVVDVQRFEEEMGVELTRADAIAKALEGAISGEQDVIALGGVQWSDSLLGGVQIRASQDQTLMNRYDDLAKAAPMSSVDPAKLGAGMKALDEALRAVMEARSRAMSLGPGSYDRQLPGDVAAEAWQQAGHNGFGVEAYEKYLAAVEVRASLDEIRELVGSRDEIEKWFGELEAVGRKIAERRASMHRCGWIVDEMDLAMRKRSGPPQEAAALKAFCQWAVSLDETLQRHSDAMKDSALHRTTNKNFTFEALLPASRQHATLIASALEAAEAGNRTLAEADWERAKAAIRPFEYRRGIEFIHSGQPQLLGLATDWELACYPEAVRNQSRLSSLLGSLKADSRATLTVTIDAPAGLALDHLQVTLVDASGRSPGYTQENQTPASRTYRLDPQTVTVSASLPGVTFTPASKTVTLSANGAATVTLMARPDVGSGGGSTATGKYSFGSVLATILSETTPADSFAIRWSDDSAYLLMEGATRVALADGKTTRPVSGHPADARNVRVLKNPHVLNDKIVFFMNCQKNMRWGMWLMTAPLAGGPSNWLCRTTKPRMPRDEDLTLLDTRAGKTPALLFLRTVSTASETPASRAGLWLVDGPVFNVSKGRWIGFLPQMPGQKERKAVACNAVSHDGRLAASGVWDQNNLCAWTIYTIPQGDRDLQRIGGIPPSAWVRFVGFSPDGRYLATVRAAKEPKGGDVLGVRPVSDPTSETVLARGAIAYSTPSWSRDGRFIALRAFGQPGAPTSESRLMVLQVAGDPYPFTTPTFRLGADVR